MNLEKLTTEVCEVVRNVALFQRQEISRLRSDDVLVKGIHDYVTYVDKESEQRLVASLSKLLPGCGFIAEESPSLNRSELTWVIDPLDGTTNFIHGIPLYCISIGLMEGEELVAGVIFESNLNECFYTWKSAPSFLNGQPIRVSTTPVINESLFATGFPYYDYDSLDDYLAVFRYLMKNSRGLRRLGSAALDLAWTACGRFDGFYEYGLRPWDVAAGALLVNNAGGTVSDFRGRGHYIFGKQIIATNPFIYTDFLKLFNTWKQDYN